jgi:hypothetical protein
MKVFFATDIHGESAGKFVAAGPHYGVDVAIKQRRHDWQAMVPSSPSTAAGATATAAQPGHRHEPERWEATRPARPVRLTRDEVDAMAADETSSTPGSGRDAQGGRRRMAFADQRLGGDAGRCVSPGQRRHIRDDPVIARRRRAGRGQRLALDGFSLLSSAQPDSEDLARLPEDELRARRDVAMSWT